jgi:hypothetical protein
VSPGDTFNHYSNIIIIPSKNYIFIASFRIIIYFQN